MGNQSDNVYGDLRAFFEASKRVLMKYPVTGNFVEEFLDPDEDDEGEPLPLPLPPPPQIHYQRYNVDAAGNLVALPPSPPPGYTVVGPRIPYHKIKIGFDPGYPGFNLFDFSDMPHYTRHPVVNGTFNTGPDARFPHKCPRCSREAYVGLSEVEHRVGELDATCK